MDRRALRSAAVAITAVLAFVLAAAAFGPTVPDAKPADGGSLPDDPEDPNAGASGGGVESADGGPSVDCPGCSVLDLRSHVATLLPTGDPRLLLGVLGIAVLGLTAVGLRSGERDRSEDVVATGDDVPGIRHTARSAGRADRSLDAPPVNDVYRAWRELADGVDLHDVDSTSPRQVARRAIGAGYPADAVASLTELFECVRYGDASATPERERRARAAADRIDAAEPDEQGQAESTEQVPPESKDQTPAGSTSDATATTRSRSNGGDR
ncbi:hypothetical protein L593_09935 [Salinarchaeum sp. Harcht-Bsk1]|uniref:DUF4129 domain-containing protein n=1 Tax=Salinarchaeum sp. Harcht-Bsk1 TaxID=1333523 RepID=UPI00034249B6|nr:DUF4129 domain-containing protein [Salinarchaeum sp. Harcht-Bsk1]AGN01932.1 hypothetical protein L593_09935 [Salinarchaeum sp. Harcht-Bsk1]